MQVFQPRNIFALSSRSKNLDHVTWINKIFPRLTRRSFFTNFPFYPCYRVRSAQFSSSKKIYNFRLLFAFPFGCLQSHQRHSWHDTRQLSWYTIESINIFDSNNMIVFTCSGCSTFERKLNRRVKIQFSIIFHSLSVNFENMLRHCHRKNDYK